MTYAFSARRGNTGVRSTIKGCRLPACTLSSYANKDARCISRTCRCSSFNICERRGCAFRFDEMEDCSLVGVLPCAKSAPSPTVWLPPCVTSVDVTGVRHAGKDARAPSRTCGYPACAPLECPRPIRMLMLMSCFSALMMFAAALSGGGRIRSISSAACSPTGMRPVYRSASARPYKPAMGRSGRSIIPARRTTPRAKGRA